MRSCGEPLPQDLLEKMLELAYPQDFPYHWPVIGYMEDLNNAAMDDVREFFNTWYAPNNASLVVSGDFEPETAKELIARYFSAIPRNAHIPKFSTSFNNK